MLLINWLYYEKTILNFEDIVFLSGKTGEGKSALIDAMQIVILGETKNTLFNKSANDKATRDLMGYLNGKYKNGTYKRDKGVFSSHLCMEFQDEKGDCYCFGIVFDVAGTTRSDMDYRFYMMNQSIPDHGFVNADGTVYDIRRMKKYLDAFQDRSCRMFTTNMDYRNYFKQRMLIKDERFFDVFKKAVAYTPMMNISEFIVKNICSEEEELDLEEMQEEINDYRQMKEQLETVKEKKEQLSLIHAQYQDIQRDIERLQDVRIEQEAVVYQSLYLEEEQAQKRYACLNKDYQSLMQMAAQTQAKRQEIEQTIEQLKDRRKDNAADILQRQIESLTQQKAMLDQDIAVVAQQLEVKGEAAKQQLEALEEIEDDVEMPDISLSHVKLAVQKSIHQKEQLADFPLLSYTQLQQQFQQIDEQVQQASAVLRNEVTTLQEDLRRFRQDKEALEAGKKTYPKKLLVLKQAIEEGLRKQYGKPIEVAILADLMDIKEEAWRNAIEGYIHNQKLNLVVEEAYFMDAYRIYKAVKKELNLHTYAVVDIAKAKPGKRMEVKTLYDCVEVQREDIRLYVEYLLGRVVCCEREQDLRSYPISITQDCMLYSGYAISHMNPDFYRRPFIGTESIERQLQEIIAQIQAYSYRLKKQEEILHTLQDVRVAAIINDDFIRQLDDGIRKAQSSAKYDQDIQELRKAQTPESLQELMDIEEQLGKAKKESQNLYEKQVKQEAQKTNLEKEMNECNERCAELKEKRSHTAMPEAGIPQTIADIKDVAVMLKKKEQLKNEGQNLSAGIQIAKEQLIAKKNHYNDTFRISLNPHFSSEDYEREYEKHSANVVEDYIDKCRIAEQKAYECFQNNFFSAINNKIENVKTQIDRLNRSIRRHQFGRSRYEFICTCNEDYREYYDLITNKELNGHNLLNTQVYEENEELIHELFDKISALSSMQDPKKYQELEKEVKRLSRFTTYLKFDILENGNSLRATIGSSSGGETQTPFYVAVLASLFSVYDGSRDGLQLAIFDEAFDKMDNERIEECIALLKALGFQAIIVTPTDKISNLGRVADMTLIAATDERNGQKVSSVQKWSQRAVEAEHEVNGEEVEDKGEAMTM